MPDSITKPPPFASAWPNLALERLGAKIVEVSDEFFAEARGMLSPDEPVFIPGKFTDRGKWMDGWETRRRRGIGGDHVVIRLKAPVRLHGTDICTRHYTGNHPHSALLSTATAGERSWSALTDSITLSPDAHHWLELDPNETRNLLRLDIYPDGGIARLRLYGQFVPPSSTDKADLASLLCGGRVIACNDAHFGSPDNLLMPGRGINMGDGWETRRRRVPGYDWTIVALGRRGQVVAVEVDTAHFKGNYPVSCSLQGLDDAATDQTSLVKHSESWPELLGAHKLGPDAVHRYDVKAAPPVTHVRFNIHPDGGVSRLRVFCLPQ